MQCKDIPDRPILEFLAEHGGCGCSLYKGEDSRPPRDDQYWRRSVWRVMPAGTPYAVARAKMRRLIVRGLASGCACGCRGDFELTGKGLAHLGRTPVGARVEVLVNGERDFETWTIGVEDPCAGVTRNGVPVDVAALIIERSGHVGKDGAVSLIDTILIATADKSER